MGRIKRTGFVNDNSKVQSTQEANAIQQKPSISQERTQQPLNMSGNQQLFYVIQKARLLNLFYGNFDRFKGTNQPINYHPKYNFAQNWQDYDRAVYERNHNLLLSANLPCYLLCIVIMIQKVPLIWSLTVNHVFQIEPYVSLYVLGIVCLTADIGMKLFLWYGQYLKNEDKSGQKNTPVLGEIAQLILGDIFTILVLTIQLNVSETRSLLMLIMDMAAAFIQLHRFKDIYSFVTIMLISSKYKHEVSLFGFVAKLCAILHFSSLFVYSLTIIDEKQNWLQKIGENQLTPFTNYIFSLYFTATTMFTVGYGDILPTTNFERVFTMLLQLLGIILIGYIVNETGHILSVIRQNRDQFQQMIQNTDKICDQYQLSKDLRSRVRSYVVNHQLANDELNINEENKVLMKLNDELRSEVNQTNHFKIIKTCLFFVCNWSKNTQNELSNKLEKYIVSPNQKIIQKNNFFIVTKGKIDIFTERKKGTKVYCKKLLKTISKDPSNQVHNNVFGYVPLFTNKPSRLSAVSKDFAVCYAIDFDTFMDVIRDNPKDFEYFHETKHRIDMRKFAEAYEIPDLINNRQHYCPTRSVVIKKSKSERGKKQSRTEFLRAGKRTKRISFQDKYFEEDSLDSQIWDCGKQVADKANNQDSAGKIITSVEENYKAQAEGKTMITIRNYWRKNYKKRPDLEERTFEKENRKMTDGCQFQSCSFEIGKNYQRYFTSNNQELVLKRVNQDLFNDFSQINTKKLTLPKLDLFIFEKKLEKGHLQARRNRKSM